MKTAGYFIIELQSNKVIRTTDSLQRATNAWKKLGREGYAIRPCASLRADVVYSKLLKQVGV
jgi:hypothetical protein